jgi:hypothetical protein
MSQPSLFEKLELADEKNLLIQGLPSSIEKQFVKLAFAKNVTPLLKARRIDFGLVFAINQNQLCNILSDVLPALADNAKMWIAYPKTTSKIVSDLNRDCSWDYLLQHGYEQETQIPLDHMWNAIKFKKSTIVAEKPVVKAKAEPLPKELKGVEFDKKLVVAPAELEKMFNKYKKAREFFHSLSETDQKEYVQWIEGAKKQDTRTRRLESTLEKLLAGKKNPTEK